MKSDKFILKLYQRENTVFSMKELALIFPKIKRENLKARVNYYVKKGELKNLRKGLYAKTNYNILEAATKIYSPSYISLETILAREGVIFQYYKTIFVVSYLTRKIKIEGQEIQYRRIKESILLNKKGLLERKGYFKAEKERAFLDALYLYKDYYFDNLEILDKTKVFSLVKIYQSKRLENKVKEILKNV